MFIGWISIQGQNTLNRNLWICKLWFENVQNSFGLMPWWQAVICLNQLLNNFWLLNDTIKGQDLIKLERCLQKYFVATTNFCCNDSFRADLRILFPVRPVSVSCCWFYTDSFYGAYLLKLIILLWHMHNWFHSKLYNII